MVDPIFSDIEHHWAKASILRLAERGWLSAGGDRHFHPNDPITRAQFAALLSWMFPTALPIYPPPRFSDVPKQHPQAGAIAWSAQRGLLRGDQQGRFRPQSWLTRAQGFAAVGRGLQLTGGEALTETAQPTVLPDPAAILADYFDDAARVVPSAIAPLARAALAGLVISSGKIRQFRPDDQLTRAELVSLLDRLLGHPNAVPPERATSSLGLKEIQEPVRLPLTALEGNPPLVQEIQTRLHRIGLHPGGEALNGKYTARTEAALLEFCRVLELPQAQTCGIDAVMAQALLNSTEACFALTTARDRSQVFQEFLRQEAGFSAARLAFLDRGVDDSPYRDEIPTYPDSFTLVPDVRSIRSLGDRVVPRRQKQAVPYRPFPGLGELPQIDSQGLDFLHPDIPQACVCIGNWINGEFRTRWLGRNALQNVQLWSATKFVPLLQIACRINSRFPNSDLDNCRIRSGGRGYRFFDLAQDLVSYDNSIASSNPVAAMFKQFDTPANLENWVRQITGNRTLQFRGRYGSNPSLGAPEIWDEQLQQVVLRSAGTPHRGNNLMSAYDLTRLIAMLGWHRYLLPEQRLPGAQWNSLETLVRVLGHDSARYADVAIARLGLTHVLSSPVILSKMGFGRSGDRNRTELVYTALVQFLDGHQCPPSQPAPPPVLRTISLTLVGVKRGGNEATHIDARLAAEITELLRRLVTQEMA